VWPAFWSVGPQWPDNGEIDIIEGVNLMVCFSYSPSTLQGAEANPGRESLCTSHCARMFSASRRMANRRARRDRLFATDWMFRFRDEHRQLWRVLCYSWWRSLGHSIRRGWYFHLVLESCESASVDPRGYLDVIDRHFRLGATIRKLSGAYLRHSAVLHRAAIGL